jgi:hypothetical protein
MENIVEDLRNEELHGEMSYISKDGVEESIGESGSNFMNEEINEKNIVKGDEEVGGEENLTEIMRIITKGMHMGMMTHWMAMV